jgi:protease-4
MAKKQGVQDGASTATKIWVTLLILFGLAIIGAFTAAVITLFNGAGGGYGANVAVIPVEGVLVANDDGSFGSGVAASDTLLEDIRKAEGESSIKAVIFRINSPGGSAVASDEVATAIRRMQKPSVAVIREVGASGAYWVASATDHVVANPMSVTGSIGVLGSYLSFGRFLEHWNVTYNQLISGEMKDVGTPFRELTPQERLFLQQKLDAIHEYFLQSVAENRNMSAEQVRPLADGRFFLGSEAKENGLVDQLGGEEEALDWINATIKAEPVTVVYEHRRSLLDVLTSLSAQRSLTPAAALQAMQEESVPMAR